MYEERTITEQKYPKIRDFFTASTTSWIIFGIIILAGIIARIFLWDFTSSDMAVWKEAAEILLSGENPYETTVESFQIDGIKHFYAYFPLWMYISAIILVIFPEAWFFGVTKGLILIFDLQIVLLLFYILKPKVNNVWRLKIPVAIWFITPLIVMTGAMHGKFDSLMFIFILLACIFNEKEQSIPESIFLSLAILTKPIALILVPFFFRKEIMERNFSRVLIKIGLLLAPILLMSIPFLSEPIIYIKGIIGVHVTREHDMGPIFSLLSLISSTETAQRNIRIILTSLIVVSWISIIITSYIKKFDIYKSVFYTFLSFNTLYWVFLVQYTAWIYTFYITHTTKSKLKNWQFISLTGSLIILSTVLLAVIGTFVKHGL